MNLVIIFYKYGKIHIFVIDNIMYLTLVHIVLNVRMIA